MLKMKIHFSSDNHLEWYKHARIDYQVPKDADVIVIAGDFISGKQGPKILSEMFPNIPVIYVSGNHEIWSKRVLGQHMETLREKASKTRNVHFLQNDSVIIDGVKFIGATLWTDYNLYGTQVLSMLDAQSGMNDYSKIYYKTWKEAKHAGDQNVTPYDLLHEHQTTVRYIVEQLNNYDGKKVVVTHHGPSEKSVHPQYQGNRLNPCYVSRLEWMMLQDESPNLWIHGHVHHSFDFTIGKTRVMTNPMGYPVGPKNALENTEFNPNLIVEV
ncbi:Ser/Thr protein phosphatase family protein [Caulobacter phage Cr30]|uniref:metallo-phosphoesterase n=1 Tax=Caulobacter phage Cr30 TaxID=1357714 RepID=UPI0004A9B745|nr:metallo-phosphoesterase [Caulobacter phage Cr30]AGS80918.1 Ser/Thr protein phosphatase family protein [Caulobacter phage Cr30]